MSHSRLGCSSITFRRLPLPEALATIRQLGFEEIDLGALPGVCDHVPYVLDRAAVDEVAATVAASGLRVRSVNGDIGDLNLDLAPDAADARAEHLDMLLSLTRSVGAEALVLPCGALDEEPIRDEAQDIALVAASLSAAAERAEAFGVQIWCETLHFYRLCSTIDRAALLTEALAASEGGRSVGVVMDFSHIVASGADPVDFVERFGDRIAHVHIRDAEPANINLSVGNGSVDFDAGIAALAAAGYTGHFALELETHDIADADRPQGARAAGDLIGALI